MDLISNEDNPYIKDAIDDGLDVRQASSMRLVPADSLILLRLKILLMLKMPLT